MDRLGLGTGSLVLLLACLALSALPTLIGLLVLACGRPVPTPTAAGEGVLDLRDDGVRQPELQRVSPLDGRVEVVLCGEAGDGRTVIDGVVLADPTGLLGPVGAPVSFEVSLGAQPLADVCGRLTGWATDGAVVSVTALRTADHVIALLRAPGLAVPTTVLVPAVS